MEGRKAAVASVRKSAPEGVDGLVTCAGLHPVEPNEKIVNVNYFGMLELIEGLRELLSIRKAKQFNKTFKRRFSKDPDDMVGTHYDATTIAVEAVKKAKIEIDVEQNRKNIRNRLSSFRYIETAHKGITERIFLTSTAMS